MIEIDLALELGAGIVTAAAARFVLLRRRRPALDVATRIAELERWHEIELTGRLAGYEVERCIAAADRGEFIEATCARRPLQPRSRRELERQLFFGPDTLAPGARWPVENVNHVQILRPTVSATAYAAVPPALAEVLAARGLIGSALAGQLSLDDGQLH